MTELRWLNFGNGSRVLQSRVYYDKTIYAGMGPHGNFSKQMTWSEWTDIPEYLCSTEGGERKVLERAK
jgi:hypothetical protein